MSRKGERTRVAALDAAAALLRKHGPARVTMADVAEACGLSRQALYLHFPTRSKLMVALIEHIGQELGGSERFRPSEEATNAREALELGLRGVAGYAPHIHDVALALDLARHDDPDARAAWDDRMTLRRRKLEQLVKRLAKERQLRRGWTVARVVDALWTLTSPRTYADFVVECGASVAEYERFLLAAAASFLAEEGRDA